jgi:oxygen-independent coproporphyrinogen-3 oxidase
MNIMEKQLVSQAASFQKKQIETIFIGGGTPSILSPDQILRLMEAVRREFSVAPDAEITMEANPGTLSRAMAQTLVRTGINRVSLGLQSASDRELAMLGRIHTYRDFLRSYELLREAGIWNINVDLMSALPGQTVLSYEKTLHQVLALHPEHISAYSLIIEEGTPFYERYREDEIIRERGGVPKLLPDEDSERQMYELTGSLLADYGYERYEISNYAREGKACRHNVGYWTGEEYLGIGLGASSYIEETRFRNTESLRDYLRGDFSPYERQHLSKTDRMAEFFYLGLRMCAGVAKADFFQRFGMSMEQIYGEVLTELVEEKLLEDTGSRYRLTPFGRDVSNQVLYKFL